MKVFSHALLFDEYDKDTFTGVTPHRDWASYLVWWGLADPLG